MVRLPQRASRRYLQREGELGNWTFHQKRKSGDESLALQGGYAVASRNGWRTRTFRDFGAKQANHENHETHENRLCRHGNRWTAIHGQRISTLLSCRSCISWSIVRAPKPGVGESWKLEDRR